MQHLERDGADEAAPQPAGAADDQGQHHVGTAVEFEHVERREARGLRQQRARSRAASPPASVYTAARRPLTLMPMAETRSRLSRSACSDRPSGECTMRRSSRKPMNRQVIE